MMQKPFKFFADFTQWLPLMSVRWHRIRWREVSCAIRSLSLKRSHRNTVCFLREVQLMEQFDPVMKEHNCVRKDTKLAKVISIILDYTSDSEKLSVVITFVTQKGIFFYFSR